MSRGDRTVPATVRAVNQYTGQKDRYLESCDSFIRCRLWNVRGLDRSAVKHLFEECNISLNPLRQFKTAYLTNSDYVVSTSSLTSNSHCVCPVVGRDGSVGIATPYGLYCPGIESRCGRDFQHLSRQPLGPASLLCNGYRLSQLWVKRPGLGVTTTASGAEVKERVELYLYFPSGPSWAVLG